jgi:hypothetical protein
VQGPGRGAGPAGEAVATPGVPAALLVVPALCDTAAMATPLQQAPPQVRAAAAAHAGERGQQRAETQALLDRHRGGEVGIVLDLADLLATLGEGVNDGDPPRARAV